MIRSNRPTTSKPKLPRVNVGDWSDEVRFAEEELASLRNKRSAAQEGPRASIDFSGLPQYTVQAEINMFASYTWSSEEQQAQEAQANTCPNFNCRAVLEEHRGGNHTCHRCQGSGNDTTSWLSCSHGCDLHFHRGCCQAEEPETVIVPAGGARLVKPPAEYKDWRGNVWMHLALGDLLGSLQHTSGGFFVNEALLEALALHSREKTIACAQELPEEDQLLLGALLVLLTVWSRKPKSSYWLNWITKQACAFCKRVRPGAAKAARKGNYDCFTFGSNFAAFRDVLLCYFPKSTGLTLFDYVKTAAIARVADCTPWGTPEPTNRRTICCPCYVIKSLMAVLYTPGKEVSWPVIMHEGVLFFFDRPTEPKDQGDWQREGYLFEAKVVNKDQSSDRLLLELLLPNARFVYTAAPDAFERRRRPHPRGEEPAAVPRSETAEIELTVPGSDGEKKVEFLRFTGPLLPETQGRYVEVKKTNHTACQAGDCPRCRQPLVREGGCGGIHTCNRCWRGGISKSGWWSCPRGCGYHIHHGCKAGPLVQAKRLDYWAQMKLSHCDSVLVGLANDQLIVDEVRSLRLNDLQPDKEGQIWAGLDQLMQDILKRVPRDGSYTLTLSNGACGSAASRVKVYVRGEQPGDNSIAMKLMAKQALSCFSTARPQ